MNNDYKEALLIAEARLADAKERKIWLDEGEDALEFIDSFLTQQEIAEREMRVSLISELIRMRKECGLTQKQLAELSGVKQPAIARLENGNCSPTLETFVKLVVAMKLKLQIIKEKTASLKLAYPALFYKWSDGEGYTAEVPDLPGCVSEGDSLTEAISMITNAASGWVLDELEDGKHPPQASKIEDVKPDDGGFVSVIVLDMETYAEKYGKNAVRKNVIIPAWLNTYAEKNNVNFSKVLREALEVQFQG